MQNPADWIRERSKPLKPIATQVCGSYRQIARIRKVVFDLYGTLFVSGVGDISLSQACDRGLAIKDSILECGLLCDAKEEDLATIYQQEIEDFQQITRDKGYAHPEVDICQIWRNLLMRIDLRVPENSSIIEKLSILYESRVNPVWPMPELVPTLRGIRENYGSMGIISNAQFFTLHLFKALTQHSIEELGFDPDLCLWSYREGIAKPSPQLFKKILERLKIPADEASQVLFVGNDMKNDVAAAARCGLSTALFAGDKRSLRWRDNDPFCQNIRPDWILVSLGQLNQFLEQNATE